jgi:hypothetical protein
MFMQTAEYVDLCSCAGIYVRSNDPDTLLVIVIVKVVTRAHRLAIYRPLLVFQKVNKYVTAFGKLTTKY